MKRKHTSWPLLVVLLISLTPCYAAEEKATVTACVSLSTGGGFISDKNGDAVMAVPVTLSGSDSYTLDDVLIRLHELCYEGGATAGYGTASGQYGLSLTRLWGDSSGNFGYQVNGGRESVMDLTHGIEDGDYIDAYIHQSAYPNNEVYARFDRYTAAVCVNETLTLTLEEAGYDPVTWATVFSPCTDAVLTVNGEAEGMTTDSEGKASLSFDAPGVYVVSAQKTKTLGDRSVTAITAPLCIVTVTSAKVTVPADATLFVGYKRQEANSWGGVEQIHYVPFIEVPPVLSVTDAAAGVTDYFFNLDTDSVYNYRVSGENYVTYAGIFTQTAGHTLAVAEVELAPRGRNKATLDRNPASNSGYNVADMYLNINPQGHLRLTAPGDSYQLIPLRSWEAVDTVSNNYFIEPDYHYTVINENGEADSSVAMVDDSGLLTAAGEGTAIVLVTYDAMSIPTAEGGPFFGAVWPENTGVFVVTVGAADGGIDTGMTVNVGKNQTTSKLAGDAIDAELDVIYFIGDSGSYTFTPVTAGCSVSVANPAVDTMMEFNGFRDVGANDDGSFTVPMREGRNIVKVSTESGVAYQVITAKAVTVTVNGGKAVYPGDALTITFDTVYHPAGKLAGIYNMTANILYNTPEGKTVGSTGAQYSFASSAASQTVSQYISRETLTDAWGYDYISYEPADGLSVPADWAGDTYTLTGGALVALGWGDACGNHRGITLTDGKAPNLSAGMVEGILGVLPDISIPVTREPSSTGSDRHHSNSSPSGSSSSLRTDKAQTTETGSGATTETFSDVDENSWYSEAVSKMTALGYMNGVDSGLFDPDGDMTRAMVVTVLHRMAGSPEAAAGEFADVPTDSYYAAAVGWASAAGIVSGVGDGLFAPNAAISRQQLAAMLYRYSVYRGYDVSRTGDVSLFSDSDSIADWGTAAMSWAVGAGIIGGRDDGTLSPANTATRAEIATVLLRFIDYYQIG